jgi:hypothetical protein
MADTYVCPACARGIHTCGSPDLCACAKREHKPPPQEEPEGAHARTTDPDTSHDAADSMTEQRIGHLMQIVVDALEGLGGEGTREHVYDYVRPTWDSSADIAQSLSPRFAPLQRLKRIHNTGRKGINRSGHPAIIYALGPPPQKEPNDEPSG